MVLITFEVSNTLLVLDAEQIIQVFGLKPKDQIPLIRGGAYTPAADDATIFIQFNGTLIGNEATNAKPQIGYITKNGVAATAVKNRLIVTGATSSQTQALPILTPIPLHTQIALVNNTSGAHNVTFDFIQVKGDMRRKHDLEKLADRDRMFSAPPAGVPGFVMNAGLRNRMGDADPGF